MEKVLLEKNTGEKLEENKKFQNAPRYTFIDIAKGIGILCVILGHLPTINNVIHSIIYSFHMPLFFIISGFCYNNKYKWIVFVRRKVKVLLFPYFTTVAFILMYWLVAQKRSIGSIIYNFQLFLLQIRFTSLWFLTAMFIGIILFDLIVRLTEGRVKLLSLIAFLFSAIGIVYTQCVNHPLFWNLDSAFVIQIFFLIGYLIKQKWKEIKLISSSKKIVVIGTLFSLGAVLAYLGFYISQQKFDIFEDIYGFVPFTLGGGMVLSIGIIMLCDVIGRARILEYFGQNSLIYYAFHQQIAMPISATVLSYFKFSGSWLCWLEFILTIIICTGINVIIKNTLLSLFYGIGGRR